MMANTPTTRSAEPIAAWVIGFIVFFVLTLIIGFAAMLQFRVWESETPVVSDQDGLSWHSLQLTSELERTGWLTTQYLQQPQAYTAPLEDQLQVLASRGKMLVNQPTAARLQQVNPPLYALLGRVAHTSQQMSPGPLSLASVSLTRARVEELRPIARELTTTLRTSDSEETRRMLNLAYNQRTVYLILLSLSVAAGLLVTNMLLRSAQNTKVLRDLLTKYQASSNRSLSIELRTQRDLRHLVMELVTVERKRLGSFDLSRAPFDIVAHLREGLADDPNKLTYSNRLEGLVLVADKDALLLAVRGLGAVSAHRGSSVIHLSRTKDQFVITITDDGPAFIINEDLWSPMSPEALSAGDPASSHAAASIILEAHGGSCKAIREEGRNRYILEIPLTLVPPTS